ncbi:MAG: hypothetical protein WC750_05925 [Patescibacteria group bacterium]|jgi:hypothetical protein
MSDIVVGTQQIDIERQLVEKFIKLDSDLKRATAVAEELKKEKELVEAELLDLLDDEGKKKSATFMGIGHVTCMEPKASQTWVDDEEKLFEHLRSPEIDRGDLIKTAVNSSSLRAYINQYLEEKHEDPPGVGYILKASLRAYPEKKK